MERNGVKVRAHVKETDEFDDKYAVKQMTVQELKDKLSAMNLPCVGRKEELIKVCADNDVSTTKR